jgi:hypothetical protein
MVTEGPLATIASFIVLDMIFSDFKLMDVVVDSLRFSSSYTYQYVGINDVARRG